MIYSFEGVAPTIDPSAYVFEDAIIIGDVRIGKNVSIWPGVTIRGDKAPIVIGAGSNIQEGAVLHADPGFPLTIEENVTVGHAVILHGCTVKSGSVIGIGSTLLNGSEVPKKSMVTAGSMLSSGPRFEEASMISGSPAKKLVALSGSDIQGLYETAVEYQELAAKYRMSLQRL